MDSSRSLDELTCHQQQSLCLSLHLGSFAVLFICAAVECLTGLVDNRLLQVHLICQNLHKYTTDSQFTVHSYHRVQASQSCLLETHTVSMHE